MENTPIITEAAVNNKKERLKKWLKDPYNLVFIAIIVFSIILRLYYFSLTKDQPLWWDEADYMAYAKNLAGFSTNWVVTSLHNSIIPYIAALLFKIGLNEVIQKFLLEFIPSIFIIFLTYSIASIMYKDKRIALIAAFSISTLWELLFDNMRFHLETPALLSGLLAIYVFFKGYEKKEKIFGKIDCKWAIPLTVFFVVLTYSIRRGYFLFGLFFLFYLLFTSDFKTLLKNKYNWIALAVFVVLFFIVENSIFISPIGEVSGAYYNKQLPINLVPLQIFNTYFSNPYAQAYSILFYLFWIGFILVCFNLLMSWGHFKDIKNKESRSDLFVFVMLLVTLGFFIIMRIRDANTNSIGDPRWYFPLILASFICIAKSTLIIADYGKKYHKYIAVVVIVVLIGYGGYYELKQADVLIKSKINTYTGVKKASLFIKSVSQPGDAVYGKSGPQVSFYSERNFAEPDKLLNPDSNKILLEDFLAMLRTEKGANIKYIIITISEPGYSPWMKTVSYAQDPQTGQTYLSKLEIPFMNTTIDFSIGKQDIKQSVKYGDIEFRLLTIIDDAFVYRIVKQ